MTTAPQPLAITWAATSTVSFEQEPVGKVWAAKGVWPVTAGVTRKLWYFVRVIYPDAGAMLDDIARRVAAGTWSMIHGIPKPGLDLSQMHPRLAKNFVDGPQRLLVFDIDGLKPSNGVDIGAPEYFGRPLADLLRQRLTQVGLLSLAEADFILMATAATGFPVNSKGQLTNGCVRCRVIFIADDNLTMAEEKAFAQALAKLPGFDVIDDSNFYKLAGFSFASRPVMPVGERDPLPIEQAVQLFTGTGAVNLGSLRLELGLAPAAAVEPEKGDDGFWVVLATEAGWRALDAPPKQRVGLVRRIVAAIRNNLDRNQWVGIMHAIDGASAFDPEAEEIFLAFSRRRLPDTKGVVDSDEEENQRVWDTRGTGHAGINQLLELLEKQGTPEAAEMLEVLRVVKYEQACKVFGDADAAKAGETASGSGADRQEAEQADAETQTQSKTEGAADKTKTTAETEDAYFENLRAKARAKARARPNDKPYDFWPAPRQVGLPLGFLPKKIEDYAVAVATDMGADAGGIAMSALAAAAGAISDQIELRVLPPDRKRWHESARIWVVLIGPPSTKKTPVVQAATEPIRKEAQRRRTAYEFQKSLWDKLDPVAQKAVPKPVPDYLLINDATVEGARQVFKNTSKGILAIFGELGALFGNLGKYGAGGARSSTGDRSFWLQSYDGGAYTVHRAGAGEIHLPNLSMSLLGAIQPEVIRSFTDADVDDGLVQRMLPVHLRPGVKAVRTVIGPLEKEFDNIIQALLKLPPGDGPLEFEPVAQQLRDDLADEHVDLVRLFEEMDTKLASALGKLDGTFARLCVVFHAIENVAHNPLPKIVTVDTARRVAEFMKRFVRPHLYDFYEIMVSPSREQVQARDVAGYILARGLTAVFNRDILSDVKSTRKMNSREITSLMERLSSLGWLRSAVPSSKAGAQPSWVVNPEIHFLFAKQAQQERERRQGSRAEMDADFAKRKKERNSSDV